MYCRQSLLRSTDGRYEVDNLLVSLVPFTKRQRTANANAGAQPRSGKREQIPRITAETMYGWQSALTKMVPQ